MSSRRDWLGLFVIVAALYAALFAILAALASALT
jgi:hypothetical protein